MNNRVRNLNLEELIFMDIETISRNETLDVDSKEFELFQFINRNRDTDELLPNDEVIELYKRKAALDPTFNKIACISYGVIKGTTFYYKALVGKQKDIIEEWYKVLNTGKYMPVTWNGIAFDFPVVRIKSAEEGVEIEILDKYNDSGKKPWNIDSDHLDLMGVVKGTYYYPMSLDGFCMLMGVQSPKSDLNGSMVTKEFYTNGVERIAKYCNEDIKALARGLCGLMGKGDFLEEFVDKSDTIMPVVVEASVLDTIKSTGKLSKVTANKIVKVFKEESVDKRIQACKNVEALLLFSTKPKELAKDKVFNFLREELL